MMATLSEQLARRVRLAAGPHDNPDMSVQQVVSAMAARIAELEAGLSCLPPVVGDVLPPIGSKVGIRLGGSDDWVEHTVAGYYAWPDLDGSGWLHRVFVRVKDANGFLNSRLLKDVRIDAALAQQGKDGE